MNYIGKRYIFLVTLIIFPNPIATMERKREPSVDLLYEYYFKIPELAATQQIILTTVLELNKWKETCESLKLAFWHKAMDKRLAELEARIADQYTTRIDFSVVLKDQVLRLGQLHQDMKVTFAHLAMRMEAFDQTFFQLQQQIAIQAEQQTALTEQLQIVRGKYTQGITDLRQELQQIKERLTQ